VVLIVRRRVVLLIGVTALFTLALALVVYNNPRAPRKAGTHCALASDAYLRASDLPGFTKFLDHAVDQPPFYRRRAPNPPARAAYFESALQIGFLANNTISGPDREAADAVSRSLQYPIGQWPLVPFTGPVVEHNPGALEVYEFGYSFSSRAGADDMMTVMRGQPGQHNVSWSKIPSEVLKHMGSGSRIYESVLGADDGAHEHLVGVDSQVGNAVLRLAIQGGRELSLESQADLILTALSHFQSACGVQGK
jgi:hypothetical protein